MAGQTRGTWRNSIPIPPTIDLAYLQSCWPAPVSAERPQKKQTKRKLRRVKKDWSITLPDGRHQSFSAYTRGEARALIKTWFEMPGRVPIGTKLTLMA